MTIKEIEELSGIAKANIRFYEKEGLITPQRQSNGYREYSQDDLDCLKRIRVLRMIHLSLEDIRALSRNECDFTELLLEHLRELRKEKQKLDQSMEICEQLCRSRVSFHSFDPQFYLDQLTESSAGEPEELKKDSIPKVTSPWIRFFARVIDETIYQFLWGMFLSLCLHVNIREMGLAWLLPQLFVSIAILLLAEPVMLSVFGTTPGKFLFGLRVSAESGARLTWREAFDRTWSVLKDGMGFYIPVYWMVRAFLAYRACKKGEFLSWEGETVLWLDNSHIRWKAFAAIICLAAADGANFLVWQAGALPQNRGALSVSQFAGNFNDLQRFYHIDRQLNLPEQNVMDDSRLILNGEGEWEKLPAASYIAGIAVDYAPLPQLQYTENKDVVTEVSFSAVYKNENLEIASYGDLMALTALSCICSSDEYSLVSVPPSLLYSRIKERADWFGDFTFSEAGVMVKASFDYRGYELRRAQYGSDFVLTPVYGEDVYFCIEFSVQYVDQ